MIKAEYINHMGDDLTVVNAARVSFGKAKSVLDDKDIKLINYLAKHKHFSPFEHCQLSVLIECPLYIRSQIHRHRTFSYNEVSRRYTSENLRFYIPEQFRKQHASSKQCSDGEFDTIDNAGFELQFENIHQKCLDLYNELINDGMAREMARGILPQNLMTEFYMTGNMRNFAAFLALRLDGHAQAEATIIAKQILNVMKDKFPISTQALLDHGTI